MLWQVCGRVLLSFTGGMVRVIVHAHVYPTLRLSGKVCMYLPRYTACGMKRSRLHLAYTSFQVLSE